MIDGFKMGFIEDTDSMKLTKIPKKYQKFIDEREKVLFENMKRLEGKLEFQKEYEIKAITLQATEILQRKEKEFKHQLALIEKALELACQEITGSCEYCSYKTMPECPIEANCVDEKMNYFKTKAKEMMKSEFR